MTTELSFLLDLLLNHRLPKPTKEVVTARIKEVESALSMQPALDPRSMQQMLDHRHLYDRQAAANPVVPSALSNQLANQAPSMQAIMARHPDLIATQQVPAPTAVEQQLLDQQRQRLLEPVTVVAQTQATAAAMASRQQAINNAGKIEKGATSPRKF